MHRAWDVDDIWRCIHVHLSKRDLKTLAQTCTFFGEVASNEVWRDITDPMALVCRLPSDWRQRPLTLRDIDRLDQRFTQAQTITFKKRTLPTGFRHAPQLASANQKKNWHTLWAEVASLRPQEQAFPNLRSIHVEKSARDLLLPLMGISGTSLQTLRLQKIEGKIRKTVTRHFVHNLPDGSVRDAIDDPYHLGHLDKLGKSPLTALQPVPRFFVPSTQQVWSYWETNKASLWRDLILSPDFASLTITSREALEMIQMILPDSPRLDLLVALYLALRESQSRHVHTLDTSADLHDQSSRRDLDTRSRELSIKLATIFGAPVKNVDAISFFETLLRTIVTTRSSRKLDQVLKIITSMESWSEMFESTLYEDGVPQTQSFFDSICSTIPLQHLRALELSTVPGFLANHNARIYQAFANQLPSLEVFGLGDPLSYDIQNCKETRKRLCQQGVVPIRHLASFCSMLLSLKTLHMPAVLPDSVLDPDPNPGYVSNRLTTLVFSRVLADYATYKVTLQLLKSNINVYFPNWDHGLDRESRKIVLCFKEQHYFRKMNVDIDNFERYMVV